MEENKNENQYTTQNNPQEQPAYKAPAQEPPKKKKKGTAIKVILIILLILIVGSVLAVGGYTIYNTYIPQIKQNGITSIFKAPAAETSAPTEEPAQEPAKAIEPPKVEEKPAPKAEEPKPATAALTPAELYENNVDSIVAITTSGTAVNYWGYQIPTGAKGSGFIVSEDGYVLTNFHVVEDSNEIEVALYNGKTYKAEIIGCDTSNDVAVLKIDGDGFKAVTIGDSDNLKVGEDVYAIGNPLGDLTFSMTQGIVSALNRPVQLSSSQSMNLIQTDCAINSGNSGGALFNSKGEVVGITNAKYSSSGSSNEASIDNIGFAIPINTVKNIVFSVIENGFMVKPYIGVYCADIGDDVKAATGIKNGVLVTETVEGCAAEQAGILANDIILKVDGKEIDAFSTLSSIISSHAPGDVVDVEIYRQGNYLSLKLTIGEQKEENNAQEQQNIIEQQPQQQMPQNQQPQQQQPGNDFSGAFGDYNDMLEEFMRMFGGF